MVGEEQPSEQEQPSDQEAYQQVEQETEQETKEETEQWVEQEVEQQSEQQSEQPDEQPVTLSAQPIARANRAQSVAQNETGSQLGAPEKHKRIKKNDNGSYTVNVDVKGAASSTTVTTTQPIDFTLVLDVSGSMAEKIASGWNQPTKIDSLKTAVNKFINATAAENAKITDQSQRNRIALVKFAGTEKTSVGNDFYREGWSSYNYTQIVSNLTYDVSGLTSTVNGLSASGATSADYAFNRAQAALTYQPRANAKKVVIFFTDGEPNHGSGFDPTVAATAVNKAKSLKDAGTTIYSIGVVSGANPGDTSSNLNKYMHGISSNYPDATATEDWWGHASWNNLNLGDRAETSSYYKAATDAGQLNNIFESIYQEITKTAEYADVTIHDRLSSWVVSSENGEPAGFTYTKTRKGQTTAWADAPEATVAADGTVSWPVTSNDDTLEDGVTYTVSFNVKPTQAAFDEALARFEKEGIDPKDLERYKNQEETRTYNRLTSTNGKAISMARDNVFGGAPDRSLRELDKYREVTVDDVMRVYEKYVKGRPFLSVSIYPEGQSALAVTGSVPAQVEQESIDDQQMSSEGGQIVDDPYEKTPSQIDRSVEPALMANTPELSVPAVWSSTLPNGMQIKGIEYGELPLVNFSIELNQGMLLDAPGKVGVAYLTAQMLNEGTVSKTPEQLEEAIGQLGASIRVACSRESMTLSGLCLKKNFARAMELVEEMLLHPRWDEQSFAVVKERAIDNVRQRATEPEAIAQSVFDKALYGAGSVLSENPSGTEASLQSITLDDLKAFYDECFSPKVARMSFVGGFTQSEVEKSLASLTGNWPAKDVRQPEIGEDGTEPAGKVLFVD